MLPKKRGDHPGPGAYFAKCYAGPFQQIHETALTLAAAQRTLDGHCPVLVRDVDVAGPVSDRSYPRSQWCGTSASSRGMERRDYLPFLPGTVGAGCALVKASAFFWFFSAASCFFRRSFDFGDLSPMDHRLRFR